MKGKVRHLLTVSFFGTAFLIFTSIGVVSFAQNREGFIIEGESFDNILIGKSTMDEVIAVYGNDYKLLKHKEYSYEMIYKNLGLSFYSCQADPKKEIFTIDIQAPFKTTTRKGIILGESTFADVWRLYGKWDKTSAGFEYEGVYFLFEEQNKDQADAENQKPEIEINLVADSTDKNSNSTLEELRISGRKTEFIIGEESVSTIRDGEINQSNNSNDEDVDGEDDEKTAVSEKNNDADIENDSDKVTKTKIVRQIRLIEKSGLRQCHVKFRK